MKKAHLEKGIKYAKSLQEKGDTYMNFEDFNKAELAEFQAEAKKKWGKTAAFQEFDARTNQREFSQISSEMSHIMTNFGHLKELSADNDKVQQQVEVLKNYISDHFYDCTKDILAGLEKMYTEDNRFSQFIDQSGGQGTAAFVAQAITAYCR